MSKVLQLLDYQWHLSHDHIEWLEEQFYKQCKEESKTNENITDDDRFENYVNPDGDFTADDIPF